MLAYHGRFESRVRFDLIALMVTCTEFLVGKSSAWKGVFFTFVLS